jgi:hypothetical protein
MCKAPFRVTGFLNYGQRFLSGGTLLQLRPDAQKAPDCYNITNRTEKLLEVWEKH